MSCGPDVGKSEKERADSLLAEVYDQLRAIARHRLTHERAGHTLQATELVHEAYMKVRGHPAAAAGANGEVDRARFLRAAAEAMRRILIDHARGKGRAKRGGSKRAAAAIDVAELAADADGTEILALDDAIHRLEQIEPRAAEIVKLRFYAGLSVEETAEATGLSERTVKREWQFARAWLFRELE